jgi:hypothetical protein
MVDYVINGRAACPITFTGRSMAVRHDLTLVKGKSWVLNLTALDGNDSVINLTSATIKFRISSLSGTTVDTRQTGGSGITITTATLGTYVVTVTPAQQTSASIAGDTNYKYEVEITDTNSVVYDQLYGIIKVQPTLI